MENLAELELKLRGKSYQALEKDMSEFSTDTLLTLLGSKFTKIGDTASSLLVRRNEMRRVAKAILEGIYTTKAGRVRAANTLLFGKADSKNADDALLFLVRDTNEESADNALFALVALQRNCVTGALREVQEMSETSSGIRSKIELAIEALEKKNPRIYSPNYGG